MNVHPAVIIHGLSDARAALAPGLPVTLLSAPGAASFAGCLWWRQTVDLARSGIPITDAIAILDCAEASGLAVSALRCGISGLVLSPSAPGYSTVINLAERHGGFILRQPPPALDLAEFQAHRRLHDWLHAGGQVTGDSGACLS